MEVKNKFGIQQTVFIMFKNRVKKLNVESINITVDKNGTLILYNLDDGFSTSFSNVKESIIYPNKEELLKTL